ncbi:MAG: pyridoxal-phosphate dependent enzyme, partial [Myxococcales bacterium]|nr:pyridoxal-phosphate dependent enzyme [Myxococcales bacterium]
RRNSPLTGRKWSRNQKSANTLFSGTLFCKYCGREITLARSAGKHQQMYCSNGPTGVRGCKLSTSKSVRIIEESLLGHIRDAILTEQAMEDLVKRANAFLQDEARKPRIETAPLKAELRKRKANVSKLVRMVENEPDDDLWRGYHSRIKEHEVSMKQIRMQVRDAESLNAAISAGEAVELAKITSIATCLGARRVADAALAWTRRHPVRSIVVSDSAAVRGCLEFANRHRLLVEPACGAGLSLLYDGAECLSEAERILIVVCGGISVDVDRLNGWVAQMSARA